MRAVLVACAVVSAGGLSLYATEPVAFERSHVRATDARAEAAIVFGIVRSPTFRSLIEGIERSDLIVYISARFQMATPIDGEIHFLTTGGRQRYLRVYVRGELSPWDRCAMIAHELQHANEIAASPSVRDIPTMDALYHRIGFSVGVDRHETDAARAVAIQVTRELSPGWSAEEGR